MFSIHPRTLKLNLLAVLVFAAPLLLAGCIFGNDDEDSTTPTATVPAPPAIGRSGAVATPLPTRTPAPQVTVTPAPSATTDGLVSVVYSFPFIWPAQGPITSFMDPEHPNGIDIGLENSATREVRAAASGLVTEAVNVDEDPLGLYIVIDHGNGVTTTYGHLDEILVEAGDEVQIGDAIGIGGSTGTSTGDHLHFEVRKNGETVDPLHVLPSQVGDTTAFAIDCDTTPFTIPSGSQALLDFGGVLGAGESVVSVETVALSGGPPLDYTISGSAEVLLTSPIDFDLPDGLDSYTLEVIVDNRSENNVLSCAFVVQRRNVPTTFYARANPPASAVDDSVDGDGEGVEEPAGAAEAEPTPEPTPTPANPWAQSPSYQAPVTTSGSVQSPSYSAPAGTGAGVQSPSYTAPGTGPVATPSP